MASDGGRFARAAVDCAQTSEEAVKYAEKLLMGLQKDNEREGISLLEVKNHDVFSYLAEMAFLMERMSCGGSIQQGGAVERTTKYRTIVERIRPIEGKLRSQIDKLTQAPCATSRKTLRARPEAMDLNNGGSIAMDDEDVHDAEPEVASLEVKKYVPPKIMAVHYDGEADAEKKAKRMERNKRRALQSTLIQELKQQYSEAPIEEFEEDGRSARVRQMDKERQQYEEDYMMRTRLDKQEVKRRRKEANTSAIDRLLEFGDYMAADDQLREQVLSHKKKGHKRSGGPVKGNGKPKRKKTGGARRRKI